MGIENHIGIDGREYPPEVSAEFLRSGELPPPPKNSSGSKASPLGKIEVSLRQIFGLTTKGGERK